MKDLPEPIAKYVKANAALDLEGMLAPFAEDAIVLDDGGCHAGRDQLRAWIQSATIDNAAVFTPSAWRRDGASVVVDGVIRGSFKGSPIKLTFRFGLSENVIARLEIR